MKTNAVYDYSRQNDLTNNFNQFWNKALKTVNKDYLEILTTDDPVELKKAVSNINNLMTLRVTLGFIDKLSSLGIINREQAISIRKSVDAQHPNTNGYDVFDEECKIIAEVKCNIPVEKNRFGAAQENAIKKDLHGLWHGKNKGGINNTDDYYKFMVIQDVALAREAMKAICDDLCVELTDNNIDTNHIYIVYIKL